MWVRYRQYQAFQPDGRCLSGLCFAFAPRVSCVGLAHLLCLFLCSLEFFCYCLDFCAVVYGVVLKFCNFCTVFSVWHTEKQAVDKMCPLAEYSVVSWEVALWPSAVFAVKPVH